MAIHPGRGEESDRKEVETSRSIPEKPRRATGFPDPGIFITPGTDRPGGLSCPTAVPLWPVASKRSTPQARRIPAASGLRQFSDSFPAVRRRRGPLDQPPSRLRHPPSSEKTVGNSVHSFRRTNPAYGKRKVSAGTWSPGKKRCRQEPNAPGGSSGGPDSRPGCLGGHIPRNVSNRPFWTERCGLCVA